MRIYSNFPEALNEIKRDLAEMGIRIHTRTYQDKFIGDDPDFETLEIQNYAYTVTQPKLTDLNPTQPWADAEFMERLSGKPQNPGEAWKLRREVWDDFLDQDGQFGYTYSERLAEYGQVNRIVKALDNDPLSRQAFISVWQPSDVQYLGGISRVPCTLGYLLQIRQDQLNLTYLQRSCDFATHMQNDIYLAHKLQVTVAEMLNVPVGLYSHWFGSLHIFKKDVKGVF